MESEKRGKLGNLLNSQMDLTTGNLFWKLLAFSIPIALTAILQLIYTTSDLLIVANFGEGDSSMSAIAMNGSLISLIINSFIGLATGANVAMGNAKGAGDEEKAKRVLHTGLWIAIISGIVALIIGASGARYFLELMNTPASILDKATTYLRIYFFGVPFLMIIQFASAELRALGDSVRPLLILMITGIANVLLNLLFTAVIPWDVAGVAFATDLSELIGAVWVFILLYRNKAFVRFRFRDFKISKDAASDIIRIGLPAGIQSFLFSICNVIIQSEVNQFGEAVVTGSAASANLEGYIYACITGTMQGTVSMVSQNYGAKNKKNMDKTLIYGLIQVVIITLLVGGAMVLAGPYLFRLFTDTEEAISAGMERFMVIGLSYCLCGTMDVFCSYLQGVRKSTTATIVTLLGVVVSRLVFIFCFFDTIPEIHTVGWLYASFPISWVLTTAIYVVVVIVLRKKVYASITDEKAVEKGADTSAPERRVRNVPSGQTAHDKR
jgi:putative MATE family efflux protein